MKEHKMLAPELTIKEIKMELMKKKGKNSPSNYFEPKKQGKKKK